jgi:D-glycero-D-manno-heptose 1,7-bisphosphate phosphatase
MGVAGRSRPRVSAPRAVFLDRDGVINELVPDPVGGVPESPYKPEDVRLVPGAATALDQIARAGFLGVVVSNQPAAAKGTASIADLDAVHERVVELLGAHAGAIAEWRYCRHHPEAVDPALRECDCRKPKPGMLLDAARDLEINLPASWMVGDADRDVQAGAAAGCRTILIENPDSEQRRAGSAEPDARAPTLTAAIPTLAAQSR